MAPLRRLTQRKRSVTERTVLAGEAAADAAVPATAAQSPDLAQPSNAAQSPNATQSPGAAPVREAQPEAAPARRRGLPFRDREKGHSDERPPTAGDPRAAAFFDCDNTLLQGAAIFYLGLGLYKRQFFTHRDVARFVWQQAWFRLHGAEDAGHMAEAQDTALGIVEGKRVEDLEVICEEVFEEVMAGKVWPGTRALVQMHLDAGQRTWLVTAAPVEAARIIARRLGMTGALGTVAETVDGVYTGRLVGEPLHGPAKAAAVRALARREGLELERCAAYSDSSNDIPMLSLVGYPYVINPDNALRRHARAEGWRVRDFRTGRKAARVGIPAAAGLGAAAGGTAAALALYRKRR
ncbi:HAD family hydrolase [Peterkaempfera bronchialis]|uniref:HAD-IB family hydrolase n=1 Tax=Peterkaempfera bronchialis TaxID=2126346 RepID=A0A345SYY7_9ACTN|nr:HAD-IB family hydrolase [Peterkaempfera bronchialis]AXI78942.1 HAD-IB family hydrolase [Peterkaempfera bronchialis]